jgi:Sec-independent protein translocase protein TatA
MDIFGIGGMELVAIVLIALIVAGPRRMIRWAYVAGQYAARLKRMWGDVAVSLQREFDEAGVDVKVPTQLPTRGSLQREWVRAANRFAEQETGLTPDTLGRKPARPTAVRPVSTAERPTPPQATAAIEERA